MEKIIKYLSSRKKGIEGYKFIYESLKESIENNKPLFICKLEQMN